MYNRVIVASRYLAVALAAEFDILALAAEFEFISFVWISRLQNVVADLSTC